MNVIRTLEGGPELLVTEMKNRSGGIISAPAMWYGAWLGDWRKFVNRYPQTEARGSAVFELCDERGVVASLGTQS